MCRYNHPCLRYLQSLFFFNDTPPTDIYTLSLHDALPISRKSPKFSSPWVPTSPWSSTNASKLLRLAKRRRLRSSGPLLGLAAPARTFRNPLTATARQSSNGSLASCRAQLSPTYAVKAPASLPVSTSPVTPSAASPWASRTKSLVP